MKQTLTFNLSTIASTASKMDVEAFDKSVDSFEKKEYLQSFYYLMDYLNPAFRTKYGNKAGTSFEIPHGSIMVYIKIENEQIEITAPFMEVPESGKVPLLRQVAGLNFRELDIAQIALKDNQLYFEYSCPIALAEPYKMYYILEEICQTGDKYDDEFATKFDAKRIYEPQVTSYEPAMVDTVYNVIQQNCKECIEAYKYFESNRKYGFAWNVIQTTLLKTLYYAHPQGQLMNDLEKAVNDQNRDDIPLPEIVAAGKVVIEKLQKMSKEELAEDLYFVEMFIPDKRRSNLNNIQENFENAFDRATKALGQNDTMTCCVTVIYNFYLLYHYNNVQDDINALVVNALERTSATSWDEAAPILYRAMEKIMEGDLSLDDSIFGGLDISVKGITKNIQNMMSSFFGKK